MSMPVLARTVSGFSATVKTLKWAAPSSPVTPNASKGPQKSSTSTSSCTRIARFLGSCAGDIFGRRLRRRHPGRTQHARRLRRAAPADGHRDPGTVWATGEVRADRDHRSELILSDVDGDGDDDLVLLRPPVDGEYHVDVGLSDGTAFGTLSSWATFPCFSKKCDETVFGMGEDL
jgi:hypothetical protein